jgi:nucleoside-diphosphate-sugar epimerase
MLRDEKILITGPAGRIAFPLAQSLVGDNEVWGIARFSDPDARAEVDAAGITTRAVDLLSCDFGDLPDDFTYVLHLAADFSEDYDRGMKVNAEATGLLLQHCHKAKAALVMPTLTVYKPNPDPWHPFAEDDPIGDQLMPWGAPYSVTKIACEGVARFCARAYGLPIVVARMGSAYGNHGGMPAMHVHAIARGEPVHVRHDPLPYSPIHDDDIADQVEDAPRGGERARHDRELVRRRGRERAAVGAVPRRAAGRRAERRLDAGARRVGGFGRRPHQAHLDHRAGQGALA